MASELGRWFGWRWRVRLAWIRTWELPTNVGGAGHRRSERMLGVDVAAKRSAFLLLALTGGGCGRAVPRAVRPVSAGCRGVYGP
jgi:hypothetical protein